MIAILVPWKTNNAWVEPGLDIFNMLLKVTKIAKTGVSPDKSPNPAKVFEAISRLAYLICDFE
jgi:hypothetical protein